VELPGDGGGVPANLNLWRDQLGLKPLSDEDLISSTSRISIGTREAIFADFVEGKGDGKKKIRRRMFGVILPLGDKTLFCKMTGEDRLLGSQKEVFSKWVRSLQFNSETVSEKEVPLAARGKAKVGVRWKSPKGWKEQAASGMRKGSFTIEGKGGKKADVSMTSFGGTAGGIVANVNRWRDQIGLSSLSEADFSGQSESVDVRGRKILIVEIFGVSKQTSTPQGILGGILPLGGETWFFKMMGDPDLVRLQKKEFIQFLRELEF
jgi:hypothetical protein